MLCEIAANAANAVAASFGLKIQEAKLLGGYANFMFKLEPFPIVARVAASANALRNSADWLAREVDVAKFLNQAGANVVTPASILPPGPHTHEGSFLSFWNYVEVAATPISPVKFGEELSVLHSIMNGYAAELPVMGALEEAWIILGRPEVVSCLTAEAGDIIARKSDRIRAAIARRQLDCQPLYGDAHHGNLWATASRPIWGDFEDSHLGPVEWDLACMTASSRIFGRGGAAAEALEAYAKKYDGTLLELLIEARTLQAVAWAVITLPEPNTNARFRKRMEWLAR